MSVFKTIFVVSLFQLVLTSNNKFFNCLENSWDKNLDFCNSSINNEDRLPLDIKPIKYYLTIQPFIHLANENKFYFQGSVSIEFQSNIPHKHLLIHTGLNLILRNATIFVIDSTKNKQKIISIFYIASRKWLVIKFHNSLKPNKNYIIHFKDFNSKFSKDSNGFYLYSYTSKNVKRYGANTLFSPFYARNAFPCFDDPIFEAPIQFNLIRRKNWVGQSIMNRKLVKELGEEWVMDIFEMTPSMQIYQFSFAINTFQFISRTTSSGHLIRYWAPEDKLKLCNFSIGITKKALEIYEKYFNSTYMFEKLDVVVSTSMPPDEIGSSTYGLLIFMDFIMFIEEDKIIPRLKQIYINTIYHEIAHQWIGNIIRIEWFDGLWIIEGLARYMEQKSQIYNTEYDHRMATALTQNLQGLYIDSTEINHKLSVYPFSAAHVEKYFDDLIFTKGFSLFKMIEGVIGKENFQYTFQTLVKDNKIKPMKPDDLWSYIDKILENQDLSISIKYLMKSWQSKTGFPIVHASRYNQYSLALSQKGNLVNNYKYLWPIPITYTTKNGEELSNYNSIYWLHKRSKIISLFTELDDNDWFILNHEQVGFFRVNYDMKNWKLLIQQLQSNHEVIPPIARLQLIDDFSILYCNGEIQSETAILDILSYLKNEEEYAVWKRSKVIIDFLESLFDNSLSKLNFQAFINKIIDKLLRDIQWTKTIDNNNERHPITMQIRDELILGLACRFNNYYCHRKTKKYFLPWLENGLFTTHVYLYGPIICNGIKLSDEVVWEKVFTMFSSSKFDFSQKILITQSLTCSKNATILKRYWDLMSNSNSTKYQNMYDYLLATMAENSESRCLFKEFICSESVNITARPFEYSATISALNMFILPENCTAVIQLKNLRFKRATSANLKIETALITNTKRKFVLKYLPALENWLLKNV